MARKSFEKGNETNVINIATQTALEPTIREIVGERIRYYRKKTGLQQMQLADQLGLKKNAISSWEIGRTGPDLENIIPLCAALSITPSQLFGICGDPTVKEKELIADYRKLSGIEKGAVDKLVDSLLLAKETRKRKRPNLIRAFAAAEPLAAGIGFANSSQAEDDVVYLRDSAMARNTDYVFRVNGESMEPTFEDGCYVSVAKSAPFMMQIGQIGAFMTEGALYIKELGNKELISHNPRFAPMTFEEYPDVRLIGKVNGILRKDDFASEEEIELYEQLNND